MELRAHANPYPDYNSEPWKFIENGVISPPLVKETDRIVKGIVEELTKVLESANRGDYSVYTGCMGTAMFLMKYAIINKDKDLMKLILQKSDDVVRNLKGKRESFLCGDTGPLVLSAILNKLWDNSDIALKHSIRLCRMSSNVVGDESISDEILYGRAGYLYGLLLANKYLGDELVQPNVVRSVAEKILQSGNARSKQMKSAHPLEYEWHKKNYLGAAHGVSGILYVLLMAHEVLTDYELNNLIRPTINWLLKRQRFKSGNFVSSVGSDRDRLVQWCHGAPGFVHLLIKAFHVYKDETYLRAALDCGDVIWERGLLTKGYSLCHGVSGNGYAFLELYKETKDFKHLHRAACFAEWCSHYPRNQDLQPDRPYSLYEGLAGMGCFLIDFKNPFKSSFPGFDL